MSSNGDTLVGLERPVLVVEDDAGVRDFLVSVLVQQGYRVVAAASGEEAAELLHGERAQLAVLDIGLPGMDGFEVAAALRREPGQKWVRVISMSGLSREGDLLRALESGVDQHLSKPVEMRFLRSLLGSRW